jgi:aminomethyltransferase
MLAIQGPKAIECFTQASAIDSSKLQPLPPFHSLFTEHYQISRTGYTGEDGLEIMLSSNEVGLLWQSLIEQGCRPVGLGARDTLRLEAGLHLYGHDMDESVTPFECGLKWTVAMKDEEREFIGRQALLNHQGHERYRRLGVMLTERGVLRDGQSLYTKEHGQGIITSGGFSPTLQCGIGLARINRQAVAPFAVQLRKRQQPIKAVKPPFIRHGKISYKELNHG